MATSNDPALPALSTAPLGNTGRTVTRLGLGGEGVLRTFGQDAAAAAVIQAAVAHGITYFDSAQAYDDSEVYYGRFWAANPAARERVFITSKSAARDAAGARRELQATLQRLQVGHIDLWQIHDVRSDRDLTRPDGALRVFVEAKAAGLVRHIGVTGHHDPRVLEKAVRELPVDTVLLPVNVVEGVLGGFLTDVLPAARRRGLGVIGMKVLGQGLFLDAGLTASELVRFALSQDIDTAIIGCSTPEEVAEDVRLAAAPPLSPDERQALLTRVRRHAPRLAFYRGRT